jgi:hypothetical protein
MLRSSQCGTQARGTTMSSNPIQTPSDSKTLGHFLDLLRQSLDAHELVKVVLGKNRGPDRELIRVSVRPIRVRDQECLSFLYQHKTKDVTENASMAAGLGKIRELVGNSFQHGHLLTTTQDVQLTISKKGKAILSKSQPTHTDAPVQEHDREKARFLDLNKPIWMDLGITGEQHQLLASMSRKWKQIDKFIEVFDHAFTSSGLQTATPVRVVDFGCGKGYLTFAVHDHLRNNRHIEANVTGIELREDLVRFCNQIVQKRQLAGLSFAPGDIASYAPQAMEIMIALHACDTATDHAIFKGICSGAAIILCSPCCHKQIRPQMQSPSLLQPVLRHGIHLDQEAEMVTDSLRALLLEAEGYAAQVFEFISHEHTGKNKMILAVKRPTPAKRGEVLTQIQELKEFYGIREQCLETLLATPN